ncbi:delta-60 repeat domain-containing protein [Myxococcus fulvus]|uniref:delta-60 repeat domain-containing protein n=1 Tax=Myxococcus fulvus TaxID=33 RepID=UPI003B9988D0
MQFVPLSSGGVIGRGQPSVNSRNVRSPVEVVRYDVDEERLSRDILLDGGLTTEGSIGLDAQQRVLTAVGSVEGPFWLRVCRVHASEGTPDSTWGAGGCVSFTDMRYGNVDNILVLPSGAILLSTSGGVPDLVQLTSGGARDSSFGTDGLVQGLGSVNSISAQSDGRILVSVGGIGTSPPSKLIRLLPSGALDTSFGQGGGIPDVGGVLHVGADDTFIARDGERLFAYRADGTPEVAFGTNGSVNIQQVTGTTASPFQVRAFTRDASGRIYVAAGFGTEDSDIGGLLVRLTPSGALDPEFEVKLGEGTRLYSVGPALAIGADGMLWTMMRAVGVLPIEMSLALLHP